MHQTVKSDRLQSQPHLAHAGSVGDCISQLGTRETGLSTPEAARRLAEDGPNSLPVQGGRSVVLRFLGHFHNVLIYVLLGAAVVTGVLQHWADTGVILAVVLVNGIVGFIQEGRAESAMAAIRSMLAPHANVMRDGKRLTIPAESLVRGDVVLLEAGDKVPADLRLIMAKSSRIQEAILTGESVPVDKDIAAVAPDVPLGDRKSMAFSGTTVVTGTARGVVVATGLATEIGRISGMLRDVDVLTTPLVEQMNTFARWLTAMILLLAAVLLTFGYLVGHVPFDEMFMAVVGLTVAAIPEGLPAVLTITLAIGVQRMAQRNVIVRKLPSIETLGAVSVICTDKTGTLTRNEMMVAALGLTSGHHTVSGAGYAPFGDILPEPSGEDLRMISRVSTLCNDAHLTEVGAHWTVEGDPMEGALLALARKTECVEEGWCRLDEIPFDAAHRYMAVLAQAPDGRRQVLVKGAPERILGMCRDQMGTTGDFFDAAYWYAQANAIARRGERVIALAFADTDATDLTEGNIDGQLTLAGLVGLMDPPRPEAVDAVAECQGAGIAVKMITGDHIGTAAAIGEKIGLLNADKVLTGADIEQMSDAELALRVMDTNIFARTSPEHKLRLVTAMQAQGLTVSMTGDGVNDAPALKRADAGVAMGVKGSEAAKEAAELVLTDDNFSSIAAAVREGRTVFDNLRKVISWTLPTSAGEAGTIVVALLMGLALPISPVQILWVNLITATTLGLALAFEPTEPGTMQRRPRARSAPLLTNNLVWHVVLVTTLFIFAVFGLYTYAMDRGYAPELAQTMSMNMLVILEIFHLFFIRNMYGTSLTWRAIRGTPAVWISLAVIVPAQLIVTYVPVVQGVMGTAPVALNDAAIMIGIGIVFFAVIEIEKQLRLSLRSRDAG